MIGKIKGALQRIFLRQEGGKPAVLNTTNIGVTLFLFCGAGIFYVAWPLFFEKEKDTSRIKRSDAALTPNEAKGTPKLPEPGNMGGVKEHLEQETKNTKHPRTIAKIRYRGKQVINPGETNHIPMGSNFIGKLLTSIDTRSTQTVQALLPYGGRSKGGSLPPNTVLFGEVNYRGQGEKVNIHFSRGTLPDGEEISIQGQALGSKDYTPGVVGNFHGNTGEQVTSVLGLSMVSGISEVMVQKEGLGQTYIPTPKATIKNGLYNGLSKVSQEAANNQAGKLAQTPEYVTVDAGTDLIITLTDSYGKEQH